MVFVPMAKASRCAKDLLYSLNLIHEFISRRWCIQVCLGQCSTEAGLCRHQCFLWLRRQRPRFAQGQPKDYLEMKRIHRTTKAIAQLSNECWLKGGEGTMCWDQCANMWQDCSLTAVQRNTAVVTFVERAWFMMAWTWDVWINAMVFVPMAQAPAKAGAKELLYSLI